MVPGAMAAALPVFTALWTANMSLVYDPLSLTLGADLGVVALGARDCPANRESRVTLHDLASGSEGARATGLSQAAMARRGRVPVVAGQAWDKVAGTTEMTIAVGRHLNTSASNAFRKKLRGQPSFDIPVAISADGALSAFLYQPEPDAKHLDNRSAVLQLVDRSGRVCFTHTAAGLHDTNPQSVAIAPHPREGGSRSGTYTIAAIMGEVSMLFQYDDEARQGAVLQVIPAGPSGAPESAVAVSGDGTYVAITFNNQAISVYSRANSSVTGGGASHAAASAAFRLLGTISAPAGGLTPAALAFDEGRPGSAGQAFLAAAWEDASGSDTAVTGHSVTRAGELRQEWSHTRTCTDPASLDLVMPTGVRVSPGGEWVAVGSWGCAGRTEPNLVVLKGSGGDGTPALVHRLAGEIWAVDVDVDAKGRAFVAASSWPTGQGDVPAQLVVLSDGP